MGQNAYSDLPQQNTKHVQATIAAQLNGATQPKNIGTFVIPEAKKPTKYGGWSVNPQLVDMRVGADIRKIRSESADVDAFGIENVRKLRQMGFTPDQINAYIKALSFNSENIQQTVGNDYKETISENPVIKETETGYTVDISPKAEKIEQIKDGEHGVKNFSQWNTNHHIHIIQRSNKKEILTEVKPATPEEIADKKASGILRPFISAKRGEIIPKVTYKDPVPVTATPEVTSTITENQVDTPSETTEIVPPIIQVIEEVSLPDIQVQPETKTVLAVEDIETSTPLDTNPFTKLTETIPEKTEEEDHNALEEELIVEEKEGEISVPEISKDIPSNAFLNRMHRTFEDEETSDAVVSKNQEKIVRKNIQENENTLEAKNNAVSKVYDALLLRLTNSSDDEKWKRMATPIALTESNHPVKEIPQNLHLEALKSWDDSLSNEASLLRKDLQQA